MSEQKKLSAGVIRNNLAMADGRTIRYYDSQGQSRSAQDQRPKEEQPGIGELRLDPLLNEWVVMAAHRQGRIFLPPKEPIFIQVEELYQTSVLLFFSFTEDRRYEVFGFPNLARKI